jgi:ribonuclease PH
LIRADGRRPDQLREVRIVPDAQVFAEGSVIVETGQTRVLCGISAEEEVPLPAEVGSSSQVGEVCRRDWVR